jgi:polyisoprenoid-binding protein YceI
MLIVSLINFVKLRINMKTVLILFALCSSFTATYLGITNWTADTQKAQIEFTIGGPFGKVTSKFAGLQGSIALDENNVPQSIQATVQLSTLETGIGMRDKDLHKETWFNATAFPQITLQSKRIEKINNGYLLTADLTMKGVTKTIEIPFTFIMGQNGGVFKAAFTINRLDFGVGKTGLGVDKNVTVKVEVPVKK